MSYTQKSNSATPKTYRGKHRFEHWYRDNQVYFITARVADRRPAFASKAAKQIFWAAFDRYTQEAGFTPWITSLLDNHYHTLGYLKRGLDLPTMIKGLHGSTAKQVNDLLEAGGIHSPCPRIKPFWSTNGHNTYFDGCIRDETQARRAYRYVRLQPVRHGITLTPDTYPHTHLNISLDRALRRAAQLQAYLPGVPYKRYQGRTT